MNSDFLLEIGCEDIPAQALPGALQSLKTLLEASLSERSLLEQAPVQTWGTPRRLVAYCETLRAAEPDRTEEIVGPPQAAAYDAEGKPTRAAESFAKKQGGTTRNLRIVNTAKGKYVAFTRRRKGKPTKQILEEVLPGIIPQIHFPRTLYWTSPQGIRFGRPIRWILALYGKLQLRFVLGAVKSGRETRGHRLLCNRRLKVNRASDYLQVLQRGRVLVQPEDRREKILQEAARLVRPIRSRVLKDTALLKELAYLCEHPTVVRGEFAWEFLSLPREILVTVMRHHQKYLAVVNSRGKVAPYFLTVVDSDGNYAGEIQRGHESVLEARLRDAQFFWNADQKKSLPDRRELLKHIVFESRLGTYWEKTHRVETLARWLAKKAIFGGRHADIQGRHADIHAVARAAELCKVDLTTQLAREFPELQGVVGGLYARAQGEPQPVASAIAEHYRPDGPDDEPPRSREGAILSLADKLDNLTACFAVGAIPSGSSDPYALRRAANAIVRILLEHTIPLAVTSAVSQAATIVQHQLGRASPDTANAILNFLGERARFYFREVCGFPYDEVNAAFAAGWDDLVDLRARLEAIHKLRPTGDFEALATAFRRIRNILEKADRTVALVAETLHTHLLESGPEADLHSQFETLRPKVDQLKLNHRYEEALKHIALLRPAVDRYFDTVLVNVEDPDLRRNRHALLAQILREFSTVADFSEIVTQSAGGS